LKRDWEPTRAKKRGYWLRPALCAAEKQTRVKHAKQERVEIQNLKAREQEEAKLVCGAIVGGKKKETVVTTTTQKFEAERQREKKRSLRWDHRELIDATETWCSGAIKANGRTQEHRHKRNEEKTCSIGNSWCGGNSRS